MMSLFFVSPHIFLPFLPVLPVALLLAELIVKLTEQNQINKIKLNFNMCMGNSHTRKNSKDSEVRLGALQVI